LGEEVAIDSVRQGATDYVLKNRLGRLGPAVKRALAEQQERRQRQQTEAALREAEMRYRLLVDSVQEYALFMTDPDGRITLWNRGAERVFGYTEREALGQPVQRLYPAPEQDALNIHKASAARDEGARSHQEQWLVRRDGTRFWAGGVTTPVLTESGDLQGYATVIRDGTERKQAETERAELLLREQRARADAEQHAAELMAANAALARSNAELEQFAYAASHDLQEPLRMVKTFAQLLSRRYEGKLDQEAEEMLQVIETGSTRMKNLIDGLLSYSRILHDQEQRKEMSDLNTLLDQTLVFFQPVIAEAGATISRGTLPSLRVDAERIGLVFQNLISNALKYQAGRPPVIHVSAKWEATAWIISVQDNGIGFDPQYSERIFGLFKRLHRADEYPGTGVGLALCKQIVDQHGGRIWAQSQPGQGTTISFSLPASVSNPVGALAS
jgi:PAS domain S-box-containing protein